MKKLLIFLLLALSLSAFGQMDKKKMMFMLMSSSVSDVNPNIALGKALLTKNAKTRAYWDFTQIVGDDWDTLTAHPDSSINGTYNLINNSGALLPSLGFFNVGEKVISTLRANTSSGTNNAFITSQVATALGNGEREYHTLFSLQDGQTSDGGRLAGVFPNTGNSIIIKVSPSGVIYFRWGLPPGTVYCEYRSDSAVIANGVTDIHLLRIRMSSTSVTMMLDGVNVPCSLYAGVAISTVNLSSYATTLPYGVGGVWGNFPSVFRIDDGPSYKYIIKHAVTDLLTDEEYLQLVASFNDFTSVY